MCVWGANNMRPLSWGAQTEKIHFCFTDAAGGVNKSKAQLTSDRLYSDLADGYNKYYRPLRNQRRSLEVTYGFALNQLIEVVSWILKNLNFEF